MKVTSTGQLLTYLSDDGKKSAETTEEYREIARELTESIPGALAAYTMPEKRALELRDAVVARLRALAVAHVEVERSIKAVKDAIEILVSEAKAHKPDSGFRI